VVNCDVAVVGGGPAGIAAALGAAVAGARTVLVERDPALGGNATHALVHTICGLYLQDTDYPQPVHPGLPTQLADALGRATGAGDPELAGRVRYLPIRPPVFADLALRTCEKAPGLDVRMRTALSAIELARSPRRTSRLTLRTAAGAEETLEAGVVVDTSGDAAAAALGGADTAMAESALLQRPSFIFRLVGVRGEAFAGFERLRISSSVAHAARHGSLPPECESLVVRGDDQPGSLYATLTIPPLAGRPLAPLDADYLAALRVRGYDYARQVVAYLRETRPGFAGARVADWPARVGIRESRRAVGRIELNRDDVLSGQRRRDEVALGSWPIELWEDHRRPRYEYPQGPCSIPLGALVSRSHPMLGMAGRCLSATHEALGALRVIGTALATGEAIGVAAAIAAIERSPLGSVDPERVRERIRMQADRYPLP
jgi:glycine/D-amino acid oxidase-like deaminating enzyme